MNSLLETDIWIYRILVALGLTMAASVTVTIVLTVMGRPLLEILPALGVVAVGGLSRLLISPLSREL
jgi:hypothetical protein